MSFPLEIKKLCGGYGRLQVFKDVDIVLPEGSTLGLLGANGVGKTTLLKTVAGLLPSIAGEVWLAGLNVSARPAYWRARNGIALAPEGRQIFGSLSVADNLALARNALPSGEVSAVFEARLEEVYELFPRLKERRTQLGGSLSGGEQQMLAVGRAMATSPNVLMLDEPTQGLAPIIIEEMALALQKLKGRFSILLIEQNRTFLELLADRVLVMEHGEVLDGGALSTSAGHNK
jgi:branched-chain amino acid transport system ATP-binding protein